MRVRYIFRLANVYTTATADIKRTILRVLEVPVSIDILFADVKSERIKSCTSFYVKFGWN